MVSITKIFFQSSNLLCKARIITFMIASLCSMICLGQNNAFKINDKIYDYYIKCKTNTNQDIVISMTDTLFERARKLGDVKAQCLAMVTKVEHYINKRDFDNSVLQIEKTKNFCSKTPYVQYFYYVWYILVSVYDRHNMFDKMYDEITKMNAYSHNHNSEYGKAITNQSIAYFWSSSYSRNIALAERKKILEGTKDDNLLCSTAIAIATTLIEFERFDELEQVCKIIEKCKYNNFRAFDLNCYRTVLAYINNDEKGIEERYAAALELSKKNPNTTSKRLLLAITKLYYYTYHKQFDLARSFIKEIDFYKPNYYLSKAYEAEGNYKEALNNIITDTEIENRLRSLHYMPAIAGILVSIKHTDLKTETGRLKVKAAIARLAETERISKLQAIESEKKQLSINASNLKAQSQRLTLEKNKLEMRARQAQINARKKEIEREELIETNLWIVASVLIAFATFSIVMLLRERRLKQNIAIEAYKAQSADRMKTAFVEDISKDMATPLRCIIEGSSKLSLKSNIISSEKEEIAKDIQSNSDYLTDLVNKILASASKQ